MSSYVPEPWRKLYDAMLRGQLKVSVNDRGELVIGLAGNLRRRERNRRYYLRRKQRQAQASKAAPLKTHSDETHRGLRWCHMPGRDCNKRLTFALFKRGEWPPASWNIPADVKGPELLMLLQERACANGSGKKRGRPNAEAVTTASKTHPQT